MSSVGIRSESDAVATAARTPRLTLIGTGTVGAAFVSRWQRLAARGLVLPRLALLANSRGAFSCEDDPHRALQLATHADDARRDPQNVRDAHLVQGDVVVDATASEAVAARHAEWVSHGVHVVTANKLGNGADLLRAQAIVRATRAGGARYGDAATVGAGLPLLRSIRELVAGGDHIHAVEGVLSGSLAWLFDRYDGTRAFSGLVREARDAGYTEPDPRQDLSGEDVRRKLLILARAAGLALEAHEVEVASLVPESLTSVSADAMDANLEALDAPLLRHFQEASRAGAKLRFVGRFDAEHAKVGLQALPADHPLCLGSGTDNRVAIRSDRYRDQPLVIQGPGAGAEVTAAALIDDVLRIAA